MAKEKPWHEKDEFWEAFRFHMFGEEKLKEAPGQVEKVISLLDLNPPAKILDLCCGIGRHCIPFAEKGYEVTGVDRTEKYLEEAREKAEEKNLDIDFVKADMRNYTKEEYFDATINLFTSFGYFEERGDNLQVLKNIHKSLKPEGKLLLDVTGKEIIAGKFRKRGWWEKDGVLELEERNIEEDWSRMRNRWIAIKDGERKEFEVSHRLYSGFELKRLVKEAGFGKIKVHGNLEGDPYDEEASRLVVKARK